MYQVGDSVKPEERRWLYAKVKTIIAFAIERLMKDLENHRL